MPYTGEFQVFEDIIQEMALVYRHDKRPWLIGYSGGKDSTAVVELVYKMLLELSPEQRKKKVYIVSSDTLIENPLIKIVRSHIPSIVEIEVCLLPPKVSSE